MPTQPKTRLRFLCLHGSRQNGQLFRDRISRLVVALGRLGVECAFPDGPIVIPPDDAASDGTCDWYADTPNQALQTLAALWTAGDSYDGVLGFSAGALMAALVATSPSRFPGCRFAILASAPARPGRGLGILAIVLGLIPVVFGSILPFTYSSLYSTFASAGLGLLTGASSLLTLILGAAAIVVGAIAARRSGGAIPGGIGIGLGAGLVLSTLLSFVVSSSLGAFGYW